MTTQTCCSVLLTAALAISPALAGDLRWEDAARHGSFAGRVQIVAKDGRVVRTEYGASFSPSAVAINGMSISRAEVKEVVFIESRPSCCDALLPIAMLFDPEIEHKLLLFPIALAMTPPLLVIDGVRWLIPPKKTRLIP